MKAIEWLDNKLKILDQSRLPWEEVYLELSSYQQVAQAIKEMKVRGAPMIGVIAAYGVAWGLKVSRLATRMDSLLSCTTSPKHWLPPDPRQPTSSEPSSE